MVSRRRREPWNTPSLMWSGSGHGCVPVVGCCVCGGLPFLFPCSRPFARFVFVQSLAVVQCCSYSLFHGVVSVGPRSLSTEFARMSWKCPGYPSYRMISSNRTVSGLPSRCLMAGRSGLGRRLSCMRDVVLICSWASVPWSRYRDFRLAGSSLVCHRELGVFGYGVFQPLDLFVKAPMCPSGRGFP